MQQDTYENYLSILKEELVPAMGCTEPIAIAYAAALAKDILELLPDKADIFVSGNIVKNVKSVVIPSTGGLKGIEASVVCGIVAGHSDRKLEVLSEITPQQVGRVKFFLSQPNFCIVHLVPDVSPLYIRVILWKKDEYVEVEIMYTHTNITKIVKSGKTLFLKPYNEENNNHVLSDRSMLNIKDIYDFTEKIPLEKIVPLIEPQIRYNTAIADEGLHNKYGASIGKTMIAAEPNNLYTYVAAYAASGSDARMSGCSLPVVINSGSGNQGMASSLPVIAYARSKHLSEEKLYRALTLSNLITIHQKTGIGRLSAYCGAVSAGCASGCGIAYLDDMPLSIIEDTIVNTLANVAGIVCDGAKPSCAAKIASAVHAGLLGYQIAKAGISFQSGDGLIKSNVENTISSISRMGHFGMSSTDSEVIKIMLEH